MQGQSVQEQVQEPFGWKIGLKSNFGKYGKEQQKQSNARRAIENKLQKRIQDNLQNGIEILQSNQHYREMYESFKKGQSHYENELTRILKEDCKSPPKGYFERTTKRSSLPLKPDVGYKEKYVSKL